MKILIVAAAVAAFSLTASPSADAAEVQPHHRDVCRNIGGLQTIMWLRARDGD